MSASACAHAFAEPDVEAVGVDPQHAHHLRTREKILSRRVHRGVTFMRNMVAGIALGITIGAAIGSAMDQPGVGVAIGIALGIAIGSSWRNNGKDDAGTGDEPS